MIINNKIMSVIMASTILTSTISTNVALAQKEDNNKYIKPRVITTSNLQNTTENKIYSEYDNSINSNIKVKSNKESSISIKPRKLPKIMRYEEYTKYNNEIQDRIETINPNSNNIKSGLVPKRMEERSVQPITTKDFQLSEEDLQYLDKIEESPNEDFGNSQTLTEENYDKNQQIYDNIVNGSWIENLSDIATSFDTSFSELQELEEQKRKEKELKQELERQQVQKMLDRIQEQQDRRNKIIEEYNKEVQRYTEKGKILQDQIRQINTSSKYKGNSTGNYDYLLMSSPANRYSSANIDVDRLNKTQIGRNKEITQRDIEESNTANDILSQSNGDEKIIEAISTILPEYIGLPYIWGGDDNRTKGKGYDCSGFTLSVLSRLGVTNIPRVSQDQIKKGTPVEVEDLQAGDLVFFYTNDSNPNDVSHVGLYLGKGMMAHASSGSNRIRLEKVFSEYFKTRYAGAKRYL